MITDFARIWRDMPKVVFSRTLDSVDWNSRLERGDPVEVVRTLKAETDGNLEVAGATLAAPIVRAGLVDEYRIVLAPTAVGGAPRSCPALPSWIPLRLVENRTFPGGVVRCATRRSATDRTPTSRPTRTSATSDSGTSSALCSVGPNTDQTPGCSSAYRARVASTSARDSGTARAGTSRRDPTLIRTRGSASTLRHHCARWPKPAATT